MDYRRAIQRLQIKGAQVELQLRLSDVGAVGQLRRHQISTSAKWLPMGCRAIARLATLWHLLPVGVDLITTRWDLLANINKAFNHWKVKKLTCSLRTHCLCCQLATMCTYCSNSACNCASLPFRCLISLIGMMLHLQQIVRVERLVSGKGSPTYITVSWSIPSKFTQLRITVLIWWVQEPSTSHFQHYIFLAWEARYTEWVQHSNHMRTARHRVRLVCHL